MQVEIDISGRIEKNEDTVIGMGGAVKQALRIRKRHKPYMWNLIEGKEKNRRDGTGVGQDRPKQ